MNTESERETGIFGLVGHNINYSMSPRIHNHVFAEYSINSVYGIFDLAPEFFDSGIRTLLAHCAGLNVTVPYKERVIPFLGGLSDEASKTGSVNLVFRGTGHNTDYLALKDLLADYLPGLKGKECILFGAGGAARTAAFLLGSYGAFIRIINRSSERARALEIALHEAGMEAESITKEYDPKSDIFKTYCVVNCISDKEHHYPRFVADLAVDFNYNMRSGDFRSRIGEDTKLVTGEQILIRQAIYSQKIWNGIEPSSEELIGVIDVK